jgi:hypothetical protein
MSSTLSVRSVVASAFCVLDQYASECFGRLRSTCGEGACGVSPEQMFPDLNAPVTLDRDSHVALGPPTPHCRCILGLSNLSAFQQLN